MGRPLINITGQTFGLLTAISVIDTHIEGARWRCLCVCGNKSIVSGNKLRTGHKQSCGCATKSMQAAARTEHGMSHTPIHGIWLKMLGRCLNPRDRAYKLYGGRGIRVAARWKRSFVTFMHDVGPRPSPKHSLDRIDNDGHYEPGNVRWATHTTQMRNMRKNRRITFRGKTLLLVEWAERTGLKGTLISTRIHLGWSVKDALTLPPIRPWQRVMGRARPMKRAA